MLARCHQLQSIFRLLKPFLHVQIWSQSVAVFQNHGVLQDINGYFPTLRNARALFLKYRVEYMPYLNKAYFIFVKSPKQPPPPLCISNLVKVIPG